MDSRLREDDNCMDLNKVGVVRQAHQPVVEPLADGEFHGLLHGAALDDGKVHAGCKRSVLAEFGEAFAVTALRSDELSVNTDEMDNVIV